LHKIVYKIHAWLESAIGGKAKVNRKLLDEFGERCKASILKQLEPEERGGFKLRMSNIGKPLRQLMLEEQYGRGSIDPEHCLKMLFGDLYECLMLFLLKSSGVNITAQDSPVTLKIKTSKGPVSIEGTSDIDIDIDNEDKVWDIKSASPYSFDNKFDGMSIMTDHDAFGYVDQIFGYAAAKGKRAGGWIVINKANGQIKVCEIPKHEHDTLLQRSIDRIEEKVDYITSGKPIPACTGVIDEVFYTKKTGNKILGPNCRFCNCKEKCHPGIQYKPSIVSKAKNPAWQWYVYIKPIKYGENNE